MFGAIRALRAELEALREAGARPVAPLERPLTSKEAAVFGLYKWTARWKVISAGSNRWPLHRLNAGLERERMQGGKRRRTKRKQKDEPPR